MYLNSNEQNHELHIHVCTLTDYCFEFIVSDDHTYAVQRHENKITQNITSKTLYLFIYFQISDTDPLVGDGKNIIIMSVPS